MIVVVVMRALPDATWTKHQNSKNPHQIFGQPGARQDRFMLLIVINYERPEDEQPGEKTANDFACEMKVPKGPRDGDRQEEQSRKDVPPTFGRGIHRKRFRCQDEVFSGSHVFPIFCIHIKIVGSHDRRMIGGFALWRSLEITY